MNWYRAIKLAAIPYGYWVSPDGKAEQVGFQGHAEACRWLGFRNFGDMWQQGWMRVTTDESQVEDAVGRLQPNGERALDRHTECTCDGRTAPTPQQITALTKIFQDALCGEVWVNLPGVDWQKPVKIRALRGTFARVPQNPPPHPSIAQPQTVQPSDAELLKKLEAQTRITNETPVYGFWLKPDGTVLLCQGAYQHFSIVVKEFNLNPRMDDYSVYEIALKAGWLKVAVTSVEWQITPTPAQRIAVLRYFMPLRNSSHFYIEAPGGYDGNATTFEALRRALQGLPNEEETTPEGAVSSPDSF